MSIEGNVTKLTVKNNTYEFTSNGEPLFTPSDIAAALGGSFKTLSERSTLAGLVFYTSQSIHEYQVRFRSQQKRLPKGWESREHMRVIELDDKLVKDLRIQVQAYVEHRMSRKNRPWVRADDDVIHYFSQLVVSEYWYNGRCRACNDTGWNSGRGTKCGACKAIKAKVSSTSASYKADFVGLSKSSWHGTWNDRFLETFTEVHIWKNQFDYKLRDRTR